MKLNPESAPVDAIGKHAGLTVQPLDRLPDDREADARAFVVLRGMDPLKNAEEAVLMLSGHSDSIVADEEPRHAVHGFGPEAHHRLSTSGDKLDGVDEQVRDRLRQQRRVARDHPQGRDNFYFGARIL